MFDKLAKLEKIYRRNPRVPLFARLADLYLRRGKVLRALALCKEGCRRFPQYPTGYLVLSKCFQARGQFEEARAAMDQALRLDPQNPAGFLALSRIYQRLGVAPLALKSLQQAAILDPFDEKLTEQVELLSGQALLGPASQVEAEVVEAIDQPAEAVGTRSPQAPVTGIEGFGRPVAPASPVTVEEPFAQVQSAPDTGPAPPAEPPAEAESELAIAPPQDDIAALLAEVESAARMPGEPAVQPDAEQALAWPPRPGTPAHPRSPAAVGTHEEETGQPVPDAVAATDGRSSRLGGRDDEELVRLFQEIQDQRPPATSEATVEPDPAEGSSQRIATATLAEIYAGQGMFDRAIDIYRRLLERDPGNEVIRSKLAALESGP